MRRKAFRYRGYDIVPIKPSSLDYRAGYRWCISGIRKTEKGHSFLWRDYRKEDIKRLIDRAISERKLDNRVSKEKK